jgi:acyl-coenzyme A thioesterase PaaI-like protein
MGEDAARAARRDAGHGARLLRTWRRLSGFPGGAWLFSRMVGRVAPYTGSMRARVRAVEPGRAEVQLRDRPRVRNHLHSVHAIAIANLGELASGLAVLAAMPRDVRGIPTAIHVVYTKKARGTLTAVGTALLPPVEDTASAEAAADVTDGAGDTVATVRVEWLLERVGGGP